MAFELIKVSELPELTTPSDPNVIPIQDGDYLKRISFENLKEAVTDDVADDLAAEVTAREGAVSGEATARGNADTAILADLASPYSASATYAVGDYCTKDGQLYRCTTAITTAEAWTSGHWSAVALGDDTRDLRSALTSETEAREAADEALEESVAEILEGYAKKDGTYEDLTSGNAEALLSDVYTENSEPYFLRKTGGSDKVGSREYLDKIVGGSLVANQLVNRMAVGGDTKGLTFSFTDNGGIIITGTATATDFKNVFTLRQREGHVLVYLAYPMLPEGISFGTSYINSRRQYFIAKPTGTDYVRFSFISGAEINYNGVINVIDLTSEFGSTIADYVYSLETATAGAGIAWLKQYIDLDTYHPFSEPTLKHVEGLQSHDTTGLNQWNEDWEVGTYGNSGGILVYGAPSYNTMIRSKTPIRVLPNTTYVFFCNDPNYNAGFYVWESEGIGKPVTGMNNTSSGRFMTYTTTAKATHLVFATRTGYGNVYKHDVSVHIRGDGTKNEVYEPYQKRSYPLDSSVVLRGVPTLVDGQMDYDGDEYLYDGTINRKFGIVDMSTLTWSYQAGDETHLQRFATASIASLVSREGTVMVRLRCNKYIAGRDPVYNRAQDKTLCVLSSTGVLYVCDSAYSDVASFKAGLEGVYLVYKLAAPTTETAEPFRQLQICDAYGTEEFVTTSEVPVGTNTRYPEDLKSKIEGLPWDLSMIAPIEDGTTASKAYTTGQYFLRNNVFCKALANIASGATFTLGTNYLETTIAAELYAALH